MVSLVNYCIFAISISFYFYVLLMKNKVFVFVSFLMIWIFLTWCNEQKTVDETLYCDDWLVCLLDDSMDEVEESTGDVEQPMMRKMVVDESETTEEMDNKMVETCESVWWSRDLWNCVLEDWSMIMF